MKRKWDIWCVNQTDSRANSIPIQPEDPTRATRYYVVLSPDTYLQSGGSPTIIPIKTKQGNKAYCIPIDPSGTNRLNHSSFIYCHQIYTVAPVYLEALIGTVDTHLQVHIERAIKAYLKL